MNNFQFVLLFLALLTFSATAILIKPSQDQLTAGFEVEILNFNSTNLSVEGKITNLNNETNNPKDYRVMGWTDDGTETFMCHLPDINLPPGRSNQWVCAASRDELKWKRTALVIVYNERRDHIAYYEVATGKNRKPTILEYYLT